MAVKHGEIPYIAVREVNPTNFLYNHLRPEEVRETPGYRFVPFTRKKRTIINCQPQLKTERDCFNEVGTSGVKINSHLKAPWMEITPSTKSLALTGIEVRRPEMETNSTMVYYYDVMVYATLHLRGNKDELIKLN